MPDAPRNRNRPKGPPSHRREQRQSSRSHRRAIVRQPNPSSSMVPSRTHRRPAPTTHVAGHPRQTIDGGEGNNNDDDENSDERQRQAALDLFNRTLGYHVDDAPYRLDAGPNQPFPERGEDPQHMFSNREAANGTGNMAKGQAGQYPEEAGSERSMIPSQGSASRNSNTSTPERAHRVADWHPDVQRQFMHGPSPWSPFAIVGRGLGIGARPGEEEGPSQANFPCELDLDEEDGDN